jgi:parallel beta-helix repeat protein
MALLRLQPLEERIVLDAAIAVAIVTPPTNGDGSLAVIDQTIDNVDAFVDSLNSDAQVIEFDPETESLESLSSSIQNALDGVSANSITFVTDGHSGSFDLVNGVDVTPDTLEDEVMVSFWNDVKSHVSPEGSVNIMGSSVASGEEGKLLMQELMNLFEVDRSDISLYASDNPTGNESLEADWVLEFSSDESGEFDAKSAYFDAAALDHWEYTLTAEPTYDEPADNPTGPPLSVFVISNQVKDYETLVSAVSPDVEVIVYDAWETRASDLSDIIQQNLNGRLADTIAFANSGQDGQFYLTAHDLVNQSSLDNDTSVRSFWTDLGTMIKDGGRVDLLACNLAESSPDVVITIDMLLDDPGGESNVSVAASTDFTANADNNGNWTLEIGNVDASIYFSAEELQQYSGHLATFTVTTLADSGPNSLRDAIIGANLLPGQDTIDFSVTGTITLSTILPEVTDSIILYGQDITLQGNGDSFVAGLTLHSGAAASEIHDITIENFRHGIRLIDTNSVLIDDITVQDNTRYGIKIDGSSDNTVQNSLITGNGATLTQSGISFEGDSDNNLIFNNTITNNVKAGISVEDAASQQNVFSQNSIYDNGTLGIDLGNNGVTPNDIGDGDSGQNNGQNFPIITSVNDTTTGTDVSFTLNSLANRFFTIEFFSSTLANIDPSGFGEGEIYLGSTVVGTDGSGNVTDTFSTTSIPDNQIISITATATLNEPVPNDTVMLETSEFSAQFIPFIVADASAPEGHEDGQLSFTVTLAAPATVDVMGTYSTMLNPLATHQAIAGSDYVAVVSAPFTILTGQSQATITVDILSDPTLEFNESLLVDVTIGSDNRLAEGVIENDDIPTISITEHVIDETDGTVIFTIGLSEDPITPISFTFETVNGSAVAGQDFTGITSTPFTFNPGGSLTTDVTVTITNDLFDENPESFKLQLGGLTGIAQFSGGASNLEGDALIYDDEVSGQGITTNIWVDINQNGIRDPEDQGIPNLWVVLYSDSSYSTEVTGQAFQTDANGTVTFETDTGTYFVAWQIPLGFSTTTPNAGGSTEATDSDASNPESTVNFDPTGNGSQIALVKQESATGVTVTTSTVSTGTDMGINFTATGANSIGGIVWDDTNFNGIQDDLNQPGGEQGINNVVVTLQATQNGSGSTSLLVTNTAADGSYSFSSLPSTNTIIKGSDPDIIFVIDRSGSTGSSFGGTAVGDLNHDGRSNTTLDAEIASFQAMVQSLFTPDGSGGFDVIDARVVLITFDDTVQTKQISPSDNIWYLPSQIVDPNNGFAFTSSYQSGIVNTITVGGTTYFSSALQEANNDFVSMGTLAENGNLIFLSDGGNNGPSFTSELNLTPMKDVNRTAIGVGSSANLSQLNQIDSTGTATRVTDTDELTGFFSGEFLPPGEILFDYLITVAAPSNDYTFSPHDQGNDAVNSHVTQNSGILVTGTSEKIDVDINTPTAPNIGAGLIETGEDRDFTLRFPSPSIDGVKGDVTLIGNSSVTTTMTLTPTTNNNSVTTEFVNVDTGAVSSVAGNPLLNNSSSADLNLTNGSTVVWAGLYWGSNLAATGGQTLNGLDQDQANQIQFKLPGASSYQTVISDVDSFNQIAVHSGESNGILYYQGFSEVTSLLTGNSSGLNGTYFVGDIVGVEKPPGSSGSASFGGWSLVVVYEDTTSPLRNITIFDGFKQIDSGGAPVTISVSGFKTPVTGDFNASLGLVAWEGDAGTTGDSLSISNASNVFNTVSDGLNPANNMFNSNITSGGTNIITIDPTHETTTSGTYNTLATDINKIVINKDDGSVGLLSNSQTSTDIKFETAGDGYAFGVFAFVTDLDEATLILKDQSVTNSTAPTYDILPADTISITETVENTGKDQAQDIVYTTSIKDGGTLSGSFDIVDSSIVITNGSTPISNSLYTVSPGTITNTFTITFDSVNYMMDPNEKFVVTYDVDVSASTTAKTYDNESSATWINRNAGSPGSVTNSANPTPIVVEAIPTLTISDSNTIVGSDTSPKEGNTTSGTLDFTVTSSNQINRILEFTANTLLDNSGSNPAGDGTGTGATADNDFTKITNQVISFNPSTSSGEVTVSVDVMADLKHEADETLLLEATNAQVKTGGQSVTVTNTDGTATGTIQNDDVPPTFNIQVVGGGTTASVTEGWKGDPVGGNSLLPDPGTVTMLVTLTGTSQEDIVFDLSTIPDTAQDPDGQGDNDYGDLSLTSVTISGSIGATNNTESSQFTISPIGDYKYESNEDFSVKATLDPLSSGTATTGDHTVTVTIENDDLAPIVSIINVSGLEGTPPDPDHNFVFTVTRTGSTAFDIVLNIAVTDGQTPQPGGTWPAKMSDNDYNTNSTPPSITISASDILSVDNSNTLVTIIPDNKFELNETFTVTLAVDGSVPAGSVNTGDSDLVGIGTIENDDNKPTVSIVATSSTNLDEGIEADPGSHTTNPTAAGKVTLQVELSNPTFEDILITNKTLDGTAKLSDVDYQEIASNTLTITSGETQLASDIEVNFIADPKFENDENFSFEVTDIQGSVGGTSYLGTTGQLSEELTIQNDDGKPVVRIEPKAPQNEGTSATNTTPFVFDVMRYGATAFDISMTFETFVGPNDTAFPASLGFSDNDYNQLILNNFIIPAVQLSGDANYLQNTVSATVEVIADNKYEMNEVFSVKITGLDSNFHNDGAQAQFPSITSQESTIVNDDALPIITVDDVSMDEGDTGTTTFTFTITMTNPTYKDITLLTSTDNTNITLLPGEAPAQPVEDYNPNPNPDQVLIDDGVVTPVGGNTSPIIENITHQVEVFVNGDNKFELDEVFDLILTPTETDAFDEPSSTLVGEGTILNDDPIPTVSIVKDTQILEGNPPGTTVVPLTVFLSNPSYQDIIVTITPTSGGGPNSGFSPATAGGSSPEDSDFVGTPTILTFNGDNETPGNEVTEPAQAIIIRDYFYEPDEAFRMIITQADFADQSPINISDTQGFVEIDIINDDSPFFVIPPIQQLYTPAQEQDSGYSSTIVPQPVINHAFDELFTPLISFGDEDEFEPLIEISPFTGFVYNNSLIGVFTISLTEPPSEDVTVHLSGENIDDHEFMPQSVTFTPENWSTPQVIMINTPIPLDGELDKIHFEVETNDPEFNGVIVPDFTLPDPDESPESTQQS